MRNEATPPPPFFRKFRLGAAGTLVQQHVYPGLSHGETVNASLANSIPFVKRLLAGQPVQSTCASGPK